MSDSESSAPPAVEAFEIGRTHIDGRQSRRVLDAVSLRVVPGEVVAIMGPSGSGKTTLLHLLGGLDRPDEGRVEVAGTSWTDLRGGARASFRRRTCGFVVQGLALLPQATAAENVEVPLLLEGIEPDERRARVKHALARVGLEDHSAKLPDELSGGQQQRVAIARALINEPALVLADEPTGSLDSTTAAEVVQLLIEAARERGAAVLLVTHDRVVAGHSHRTLHLRAGRLDVA